MSCNATHPAPELFVCKVFVQLESRMRSLNVFGGVWGVAAQRGRVLRAACVCCAQRGRVAAQRGRVAAQRGRVLRAACACVARSVCVCCAQRGGIDGALATKFHT